MKTKVAHFEVKADESAGEGIFVGYASIFGNRDSYGDVVVKGAFAKSLATYGDDGAGIPCYWSHQMMSDPMLNIGVTQVAVEDEKGLKVRVQLDIENNPKAAYAYRLLKEGRVKQMSFAYDIVEGGPVTKDGEDYYELRELKIHEVSVVPVGANQDTEILEVKTRSSLAASAITADTLGASAVGELKAPEVVLADSVKQEIRRTVEEMTRKTGVKALTDDEKDKLTAARDALTALLDAADSEDDPDDGGDSTDPADDGSGESSAPKSAPKGLTPASVSARLADLA